MAIIIKVPSEITVDGVLITNKIVDIRGNMMYVTLYAQMEDDVTMKVVAGPQAFSGSINKNRPDAVAVIEAQLIDQIKQWEIEKAEELTKRTVDLATLATDVEAGVAAKAAAL